MFKIMQTIIAGFQEAQLLEIYAYKWAITTPLISQASGTDWQATHTFSSYPLVF